jgi:heptosyltransferase-2
MMNGEAPKKILVRAANWLGDVVMATPAFRALREGFPDAHITLHLREAHLPLLQGAPWFDELRPLRSYHEGFGTKLREARELRAENYDLGLCLPDSYGAALLMRLGGVKRIVGYRRGFRSLLLHQAVAPPGRGKDPFMVARELHELGLVKALGCEPVGPGGGTKLELFPTSAEAVEAGRALRSHQVDPARPIVVMAPGASFGPSKIWPLSSFAAVGDELAAAGASVCVLGAPSEKDLANEVCELMAEPAVNLAGEMSLGATKALMARARLLICNDAGARHIAVAFGVPCVVPMGPTSLEKTPLNLERVSVLTADDVECRPCYKRVCPIDHRCMTRITPQQVVDVSLASLRTSAESP